MPFLNDYEDLEKAIEIYWAQCKTVFFFFKILSSWDKIPPYKHLTAVQYFSSVI